MKRFQIAKGLTIKHSGQLFEFTDRSIEELYFQQPETGKRLILLEIDFWTDLSLGIIEIVPSISTSQMLLVKPEENVSTAPFITDLNVKYMDELNRRISYIHSLQRVGITRGQRDKISSALPDIARELKDKSFPKAPTVQHWWRLYENSLDSNEALISRNAHKQRRKSLETESEYFLQDQMRMQYLKNTRPSINTAYQAYRHDLLEANLLRISNGQSPLQSVSSKTFHNRIKALPRYEVLVERYGREYARRHLKVSKGALPSEYPLDVVEIDHTPMNLFVIDDLSFLPLGRPTMTAIKDRYSGVLLGMYISFHGGGLASISGAIKHSLTAHRLAFDLWSDLEHQWPAYGLGSIYSSDRGADYFSQRYRAMIFDLGANYEYCEVRTPWLKGSIERFFLTLEQNFFETMPGKTFSSLAQRKDYDPAKHAVIRFSTLIYLIHKWAVDYHNVTPHSRKMATPLELWQEGIGIAPPPMPASVDKLNIILGDRRQGMIRNEGIQFQGLHYSDDTLQEMANRFGKGVKVDFVISPDNLGHIHVKDPGTHEYVRINVTRPDYAHGLTLFQHNYIKHEASEYLKSRHSIDQLFSTRRMIEARIQEDVAIKENATKKQFARIAGINSNAVLDGEARSTKTPFQNTQNAQPASSKSDESPFTAVPSYTWGE